jgi:sulfatase modifying factor 1
MSSAVSAGPVTLAGPARDMARIPAGEFRMGSGRHYPEEAPERMVSVGSFWIDRTAVTNRQYAAFVKATGYITVAQRPADPAAYPGADPALLVPSSVVFRSPPHRVSLRDPLQWWHYLPGADWRHPDGPESTIDGLDGHPVVHIAYADALAYASWAGGRLPTETEWEYAAGAGALTEFAWGDELTPGGKHLANVWQGEFPLVNLATDGYDRTAPVGSFPPNAFGLYDMIGNVWEWTSSPYDTPPTSPSAPAATQSLDPATSSPAPCCGGGTHRPDSGDSAQTAPGAGDVPVTRRVMKGGSFLCAPNYCRRYRPAARMAQDTDTSTCHLGFRLAR